MPAELGKVASLWRYPVKSMQGEELSEAEATQHGLLGDRVYALVDVAEGKTASAKNESCFGGYKSSRHIG
jgi:uncharacterized protein